MMRVATGKVVDGRVVVEGEALIEGEIVTVILADEASFVLSAEQEAELVASIAEADRGDLLDMKEFLGQLKR